MSVPQRRPTNENNALIGLGLATLGVIAAVIYIPAQLYARFGSESGRWLTPANPITVIPKVLRGVIPWSPVHTTLAVGVALLLLAGWLVVLRTVRRSHHKRSHVHNKARHMGTGRELSRKEAVRKVAKGNLAPIDISPGFMLARALTTGGELWAAWRDGVCAIMGPGGGKTSGLAVPLILDAPGAVFVTSNKRDIADIIRKPREAVGEVWEFDPQRIADRTKGGPAPWYWNVLSYVTDETKAHALAQLFAGNDKDEGAKSDPYFDAEGPQLLSRLMLAAAIDGRYLDQVFRWLAEPADMVEAMDILIDKGFPLSAAGLRGIHGIRTSDQGIGVIGTAMKAIRFLDNRTAMEWIRPFGPGDMRQEFIPKQFVRSQADTLVSLSKEGNGSFGPITAAMVMAILDAAEEYAEREGGGKMPIPLLGMLDEAANICKIPDLPKKYSFYGSYSIFLVTILQNWSQGVLTWGEHGMSQLWSASTFGIVGAGIKDEKFLGAVSKGIGPYDAKNYSRSTSTGRNYSVSTSDSFRPEDIMSISELQEMPPGTVIVQAMGSKPVMGRTIPYWKRDKVMAAACKESQDLYGPRKTKV